MKNIACAISLAIACCGCVNVAERTLPGLSVEKPYQATMLVAGISAGCVNPNLLATSGTSSLNGCDRVTLLFCFPFCFVDCCCECVLDTVLFPVDMLLVKHHEYKPYAGRELNDKNSECPDGNIMEEDKNEYVPWWVEDGVPNSEGVVVDPRKQP